MFSGGSRPLVAVGLGAAGILASLAVLTPLVAGRAARIVGAPLVRLFGEPARRAASLAVLDAVSSEH